MVIFNSYVSLPEGKITLNPYVFPTLNPMVLARDVCSSCSPSAAAGGHEDLPCPRDGD